MCVTLVAYSRGPECLGWSFLTCPNMPLGNMTALIKKQDWQLIWEEGGGAIN